MKFIDETNYYLGAKKETVVQNWEDVLTEIRTWL